MTLNEIRKKVLEDMNICVAARDYLLAKKKSKKAIREIDKNPRMFGGFLRIESNKIDFNDDMEDGLIRLNVDDVCLSIRADGSEWYVYVKGEFSLGRYAEIIKEHTYDEFKKALEEISDEALAEAIDYLPEECREAFERKLEEMLLADDIRKQAMENMSICIAARDYLLTKEKSKKAIREIYEHKTMFGKYLEIEAKILGNTGADWIRLNVVDVYLFMQADGTEWYQLDPLSEYGAELIDVLTYDEFKKKLKEIPDERLLEIYKS